MQNNYDINKPRLKYSPEIIKIDDKNFISISEYEKRLDTFFDIIFNNNGNEIFVGRYIKEFDRIKAAYNNGMILVYSEKYISDKSQCHITKVYTLYDILDDVHYSLTEEDALNTFDDNINRNYLLCKNKLINRSDVQKKHINKK